jgi:hypothetical protein
VGAQGGGVAEAALLRDLLDRVVGGLPAHDPKQKKAAGARVSLNFSPDIPAT